MNENNLLIAVASLGITVIAVGVALAGVILTSNRALWQDMSHMRAELRQDLKEINARVDALRQEMRTDIASLHSRIDAMNNNLASRIDKLYQALFNHKDPVA
ncbi:MAG: hypothetical protein OXG96_09875 [Acidobacteria bacterium]|nr:hypothetical protein [Acidobacteriota bacterium]